MKFILAGSSKEFDQYLNEQGYRFAQKDIIFLSSRDKLRGCTLLPDRDTVIRYGTWVMRPDLAEIEEELRYCTHQQAPTPKPVVRKIEITIHDGNIDVWEGEKHTGQLCWDEMLGQIVSLTHPEVKSPRYPMLADHQWREREQRLRNRIEPTGGSNPPDGIPF